MSRLSNLSLRISILCPRSQAKTKVQRNMEQILDIGASITARNMRISNTKASSSASLTPKRSLRRTVQRHGSGQGVTGCLQRQCLLKRTTLCELLHFECGCPTLRSGSQVGGSAIRSCYPRNGSNLEGQSFLFVHTHCSSQVSTFWIGSHT